jgi:ATP adenylyltransferase
MDALWAPWRMESIEAEKPQGCIFCLFPAEQGLQADRKNLVLGRSAHAFAILNKYPYNSGHLMVVPRRHTADFPSLPEDFWICTGCCGSRWRWCARRTRPRATTWG